MALTLTIVRHGDTFAPGEPPRRVGARTDLPLVASGVAQAERLGRAFAEAGTRFDAILVSPLLRARATAAAIAAHQPHAMALTVWETLAEIDHGPDEDRPEAEVEARIGRAALTLWDREGVAPPGWTVGAEARCAAWQALYRDAARGHMLLVTSNGAARFALLANPTLATTAAAMPSLKLRTGAWGRIGVTGGVPRLEAWNVRP